MYLDAPRSIKCLLTDVPGGLLEIQRASQMTAVTWQHDQVKWKTRWRKDFDITYCCGAGAAETGLLQGSLRPVPYGEVQDQVVHDDPQDQGEDWLMNAV